MAPRGRAVATVETRLTLRGTKPEPEPLSCCRILPLGIDFALGRWAAEFSRKLIDVTGEISPGRALTQCEPF
ncbi:hypothetical protein VFPBJ_11735 [Purpureocillium lilacinum]|uniref:Uncharacterized protein n=1 Tax=Purpureocillium lilacinum TaxID=33203 RepID=A0A179EWX4_PURLI|nr:hypothetical protein VFPBJ_11735 [Purpureocillium lilacinum]